MLNMIRTKDERGIKLNEKMRYILLVVGANHGDENNVLISALELVHRVHFDILPSLPYDPSQME